MAIWHYEVGLVHSSVDPPIEVEKNLFQSHVWPAGWNATCWGSILSGIFSDKDIIREDEMTIWQHNDDSVQLYVMYVDGEQKITEDALLRVSVYKDATDFVKRLLEVLDRHDVKIFNYKDKSVANAEFELFRQSLAKSRKASLINPAWI